jgi:hypothetical protein
MAVVAGSSTKLNSIKGVAAILEVTASELTALADKVFPKNLILKEPNGKFYLTDGTTKLSALTPIIDQVVTEAEKGALSAAFSTGSYVQAAGGVVVHGADGKISDDSLHLVKDGKLDVATYMADYIDAESGKVLLDALPDSVRAGITYVKDIAARDALGDEAKRGVVFVIDATGDSTVTKGAAMYAWVDGAWQKYAEVESLDIDVAAIECNYENVQKAGAVMYDHTISVEAPTVTELATLAGL